MLKNKTLTYVSLFSSGGVGCYGFKLEGYKCIATNEILSKRMDIQRANNICQLKSGYIVGDISSDDTKQKIYSEIDKWKKKGNDRVDVVVATPPCQGISVINHKKNDKEIKRNSLVVDSVEIVKSIKPRVVIFENVMAFQKTLCTTPDNRTVPIGDYIQEALGDKYFITGRIMNLMNYGSNSSRTRTIVICVDKAFRNSITPYDLFPNFEKEKNLRDVIFNMPRLEWGEISKDDFYHAFRTYNPRMKDWIHGLKEGESAFDNSDPKKRPHKLVNGQIVENVRKNRDKYTRQPWDRFIQCIHTRNDQLAAQNTVHPEDDRVYSIRELMLMMTIPNSFRWLDLDLEELNGLSQERKKSVYKSHELTIRRCIGEAVPTEPMRRIAFNIKSSVFGKHFEPQELNRIITAYDLEDRNNLKKFLRKRKHDIGVSALMRITELCNAKREENSAFYTNKFIVNEVMNYLPNLNKKQIRILEPSVGAGNFIPFLLKRYEDVEQVILDLVDIDKHSIENLKLLLKKIDIPSNFKVNIICEDFLLMKMKHRYDLVVGNPPFGKIPNDSELKKKYLKNNRNKNTNNLSELFLEKSIQNSDYVALILNKTLLSTHEFEETRNLLREMEISTIIDFGRYGFTGVSIETMCLMVNPKAKPKTTMVYSLKSNEKINQEQKYITDPKFPYFIIYRDKVFDSVLDKLEFDVFDVFRDRQITKAITSNRSSAKSLWVIKARNIDEDGEGVTHIEGYDQYIQQEIAENLSIHRFVNNDSVYLTPNMTYNPRVIENIPNTIPDGSTAVLIPKQPLRLSSKQMKYFSTFEYRQFYKIARNRSTQSINVDKTSVYFFGILRDDS